MINNCFDSPPESDGANGANSKLVKNGENYEVFFPIEAVTMHRLELEVVKGSRREVEENGQKYIVYTIPKSQELVAKKGGLTEEKGVWFGPGERFIKCYIPLRLTK